MRYHLIPFFVVSLLGAGCAGTQQASVPVVNPVVATESAPVLPAGAVVATAVVGADATPANPVPSRAQPQSLDPLQCMVAWSKNVQGSLMPRAQAEQIHTAVR